MKPKNEFRFATCFLLGMIALAGCSKQIQNEKGLTSATASATTAETATPASLDSGLIAYKNSPHQLFYAYGLIYYDTYDYGSGKTITTMLDQLPDSVDIVSLFS